MPGAVLKLDDDNDIPVFCRHVEGIEAVAQKVRTRLLTHTGDWVLDKNVGLPFLDWLGEKDPATGQISAVLQAELEEIPEVVRVENLTVTWNVADEQLEVTGAVFTEFGELAVVVLPGATGNSFPASVQLIGTGTIAG